MRIFLSVGHSLLRSGMYTSAVGFCNEYKYCKKLSKQVKKSLEKKGHKVDLVVCPERKFMYSKEEKTYKLSLESKRKYDLVMELHLNASDNDTANGTEVLYYSSSGKLIADKIQSGLSGVFRDRGIKCRDDLYMLKATRSTAVIVESFFCTNRNDYAKAKGLKNRKKIAEAIVKYL